ncbi:Dabb family protein [Stella sp.]|uniref:Dabb family protein n=1 Tax=Stella sp. TaxID=2912054 RepID=UPI0035B062FE
MDRPPADAAPVRHVCLFRLKRPLTAADRVGLDGFTAALRAADPAILDYRFVDNGARKAQGYTLVLDSVFASRAAIAAYVRTPLHDRLAAFMDDFVADTIVADY